MPNGLALATLVLIAALVFSYTITLLLSLLVSPSHTKRKEMKKLIEKLELKDGDVFADLGCGDGRVVFEVAKNFKKVRCIGYEISPIHIMIANLSKLLLFPFSKRVMIIPEDFTKADLSNIDVFYINWGSNITPRLEDLKKSLENDKNSRVIEL
jgi:precorrin-6B methylase 2